MKILIFQNSKTQKLTNGNGQENKQITPRCKRLRGEGTPQVPGTLLGGTPAARKCCYQPFSMLIYICFYMHIFTPLYTCIYIYIYIYINFYTLSYLYNIYTYTYTYREREMFIYLFDTYIYIYV